MRIEGSGSNWIEIYPSQTNLRFHISKRSTPGRFLCTFLDAVNIGVRVFTKAVFTAQFDILFTWKQIFRSLKTEPSTVLTFRRGTGIFFLTRDRKEISFKNIRVHVDKALTCLKGSLFALLCFLIDLRGEVRSFMNRHKLLFKLFVSRIQRWRCCFKCKTS